MQIHGAGILVALCALTSTLAVKVTPPVQATGGGLSVAPVRTPSHITGNASTEHKTLPRLENLAGEKLLEADGVNFAKVGCKVSDNEKSASEMPPYKLFMPACMKHLRQLIAEIDGSYTDVQLLVVLEHECRYKKQFPQACDSGFEKDKHCRKFAEQLVAARDDELQTASQKGYHIACEDYFVLRGGVLPQPDVNKTVPPRFGGHAPMFDKETMPPVSMTLKCIINLTLQYFIVYTVVAIVESLRNFGYEVTGIQKILEAGTYTVTYAPMLCVLFLGARMRAIQLSQGETEKYQLPQPWVKNAMFLASTAVFLQVVLVLLVGCLTGLSNVTTDEQGNLDLSKMTNSHPVAVKLVTIAKFIVMAMLYGGFTTVVIGVFMMEGPKEIWGDRHLPVSPAVMCTILLSGLFFLVYLLVAITTTCSEISSSSRSSPAFQKLQNSATSARMTVNFAPMLCILFIGARMRALQIDPKNGNPQSWAQKCFFLCTFSVLIQALLVILLPFVANVECKRGACEGDISFQFKSEAMRKVGVIMTVIRYVCLLALYGGIIVVVYSVHVIQHPDGPSKTPPVSPAMRCVISLTAMYFIIYSVVFLLNTIKSFMSGQPSNAETNDAEGGNSTQQDERRGNSAMSKLIAIFGAALETVMFAPMLSILFIGARMRALQLTKAKNGTIPTDAGPQKWVQDAMYLATWSVFVQLIMTITVPFMFAMKANAEKAPSSTRNIFAIFVEVVRYLSLACMYGGAIIVMVGIFTMTPDSLPPYNEAPLVPGVAVPKPISFFFMHA